MPRNPVAVTPITRPEHKHSALSRLMVAALLSVCITGCGVERTAIEDAKEAVKERLSDPESTQFEDVFVATYKKETNGNDFLIVCGRFNAKNKFGGYVGFTRFSVMQTYSSGKKLNPSAPDLESEYGGIFEDIVWKPSCIKK